MNFNSTPYKSRPPPGQQGSTPFLRSPAASRFRSSLVPPTRQSPARPSHTPAPAKLTSAATSSRDLFRTSTPGRESVTAFAPSLPAGTARLPTSTRKLAPRKSVSTGMWNTAGTDPFKMRIPSPDADLTGQALAKQVPKDPNRPGTLYADQYLADKCPPAFDDLQRRQFFCILDLRRLKYAADEIFAKKDWKLNVLNFAKEFEKSRGLIMLRYGLYEFKNVKPSSQVLKKWRAAHGLPQDPEEGQDRTPATTSSKRKADEELAPKDNTLMSSTSNKNKRRNLAQEFHKAVNDGPAPFKTPKRKADENEQVDENKPNKLQKSTPSAATSLFENIINKPRNGGASPLKPTPQPSTLFGISKLGDSNDSLATKPNPFQPPSQELLFGTPKPTVPGTGSILSSHKIGTTPPVNTGNIFRYLSASPSSDEGGDDNADGHETASEPEQDSDEQGLSAAVSTNTSTPPVQTGSSQTLPSKSSNSSNIFGGLAKPAESSAKGGLFGRVKLGPDGQPIRASPSRDDKRESAMEQSLNAGGQQTKTPAQAPGDYTFNPATTPISFGRSTLDVSKSVGTSGVGNGAKPDAPEPNKAVSIFETKGQASSGPNPSASQLFGATPSKPADTPFSMFSSQKTDTASFSSAAKLPSTGDQQKNEAPSGTEKPSISIFGKPAPSASTSESKSTPSEVDGKASSVATATKSKVTSIFDKSFIAQNAAQSKTLPSAVAPSPDLFSRGSNPLFGTTKDAKADSNVSGAKDEVPSKTPSIFDQSFIAKNAAETKQSDIPKPSPGLFNPSSNPLFGGAKANGTVSSGVKSNSSQEETQVSSKTTSINGTVGKTFGSQETTGPTKPPTTITPAASATPIFGSSVSFKPVAPGVSNFGVPEATKPAASSTSSIFGQKKLEEAKPAPSIFNKAPAPDTKGSIFGLASQPNSNSNATSSPMVFGAGSGPSSGVSFGAMASQTSVAPAAKLDFQFGASGPSANSSSFAFGQDASSSSSFTFTAGGDNKTSNPFSASTPNAQSSAPMFGAGTPSSKPASGFTTTFGQGPSAKTASSFGQASGTSIFGANPASSTPKPASSTATGLFGGTPSKTAGAPSLSFTQATPTPNSSDIGGRKLAAPTGSFGHLQASQASEGTTIANSSFPAPSSIGTTPVNGTPEPLSPREDGDEGPQEQITLTEGRPGEEDEAIIHEVRAKAIKFIPVEQRNAEKQSSPWETQGVGPLRVLKNNSSGAVRILLRAEPRGHIAMNKMLLSDVEYKAKEKTVTILTASDNGSGLETWLLQVKKPQMATELAGVLEAQKLANKQSQ